MGLENMEERINRVETRQTETEKKIVEFSMSLQEFGRSVARLEESSKQNDGSLRKISEDLGQIRLAMTTMQLENKNDNINFSKNVSELKEEVKSLKGDVHKVDDKTKFDFAEWVKLNFVSVITAITMLLHVVGIIK